MPGCTRISLPRILGTGERGQWKLAELLWSRCATMELKRPSSTSCHERLAEFIGVSACGSACRAVEGENVLPSADRLDARYNWAERVRYERGKECA